MNEDFEEFFALLNANSVEYLLVGGVAYNFHAPPRATKDIDLWLGVTPSNLQQLKAAVSEFGFPSEQLPIDELEHEGRVIMLGRVPYRIDILSRLSGVAWEDAWARRVEGHYGVQPIHVISRRDLIATKLAAGRPRDLADVATLKRIDSEIDTVS